MNDVLVRGRDAGVIRFRVSPGRIRRPNWATHRIGSFDITVSLGNAIVGLPFCVDHNNNCHRRYNDHRTRTSRRRIIHDIRRTLRHKPFSFLSRFSISSCSSVFPFFFGLFSCFETLERVRHRPSPFPAIQRRSVAPCGHSGASPALNVSSISNRIVIESPSLSRLNLPSAGFLFIISVITSGRRYSFRRGVFSTSSQCRNR